MFASLLSDLKIFLSLTILSLFLILADNFGYLNFIKSLFGQITIPIQYGLYKTSNSVLRQFEFIILSGRASSENRALKEQLAQILSENSRLTRELSEAQGFLAQQKTFSPFTFNLEAARPIGISRYLVIDKGGDDGISLNQAVIYKDSYIGKVKEVSPKKSLVLLSSDPDSKLSAFVSNPEGRARGVLIGQFGSEMLLDKILHQESVKVHDLVYSQGVEVEIPRGLVLGQVTSIDSRDNEVFKQAKVKPVFEISDLDVVFVITN